MVRNGRGRQKIEMIKMKKKSNLQVTFSKRRFGLFKKASELCTLCGAKVLMIVFSPGGKVFSFGHPNVKDLVNRFLNRYQNSLFLHQYNNNNLQLVESRPDESIQRLNEKLTEVLAIQESEKSKRKFLDAIKETREQKGNWYENDVKKLDMNQTNHLIHALLDVKKKLISDISQYSQTNVPQNYLGESSGNITPGIIGGRGNDGGLGHFDQRTMLDLNAFNYNPNMISPNYGPSFGYYNNGVIIPGCNMNYM
ncbi:hypothetical protein EUTSA_v10027307mg [Eutrema salsugineum]|uniref:MADS-box domain-containing protein n=1 Tax=Eutrema salsugineum TaxID=72664 RepID=V4ML36_EUTSA|nr:agamous-like MADS-box protein AGL62 [Eutrema salsugineum]ESQ53438.1 hypothetical protein EUTSA_v10027307mg [Eutrema salsugineum]